jgi:hypothetical protein
LHVELTKGLHDDIENFVPQLSAPVLVCRDNPQVLDVEGFGGLVRVGYVSRFVFVSKFREVGVVRGVHRREKR